LYGERAYLSNRKGGGRPIIIASVLLKQLLDRLDARNAAAAQGKPVAIDGKRSCSSSRSKKGNKPPEYGQCTGSGKLSAARVSSG